MSFLDRFPVGAFYLPAQITAQRGVEVDLGSIVPEGVVVSVRSGASPGSTPIPTVNQPPRVTIPIPTASWDVQDFAVFLFAGAEQKFASHGLYVVGRTAIVEGKTRLVVLLRTRLWKGEVIPFPPTGYSIRRSLAFLEYPDAPVVLESSRKDAWNSQYTDGAVAPDNTETSQRAIAEARAIQQEDEAAIGKANVVIAAGTDPLFRLLALLRGDAAVDVRKVRDDLRAVVEAA